MRPLTSRSRTPRTTATVLAVITLALGATVAVAAPGDLDTSFDGDGVRTIDYLGSEIAEAVLVQPDGKILLAGHRGDNFDDDFVLMRLNPDGSNDLTFAGTGAVRLDFGGRDNIEGAALQPDGKILVAGFTQPAGGNADVAVARFNTDGSPDASFDGDGRTTIDYQGGVDSAAAVLVQRDGRIVLAGTGSSNQCFMLTRLNPDGSPDRTFTGDEPFDVGSFCIGFGAGVDSAWDAVLQADGKIVVSGTTFANGNNNLAIARVDPERGTLDRSFDGDGMRTIDHGGTDVAAGVLVQPDGKLVLTGFGAAGDDFSVTRLNSDGSSDQSFDGDGTANVDFGGSDRAWSAGGALQANGKIVVVGSTNPASDAAIVRLQPGGALDTTFSADGRQTIDVGSSTSGYGVGLQSNGRILLAGQAGGATADMLVARLEGDSRTAGGAPAGGPGGQSGGPGGQSGRRGVPRCAGRRATIVGSERNDRLKGTRRADVIVALGGNDRISAGRGNDLVCAGSGKDRLAGGPGNDRLDGGTGNDRLAGQAGRDTLLGRSGRDQLDGGAGRDRQRQ